MQCEFKKRGQVKYVSRTPFTVFIRTGTKLSSTFLVIVCLQFLFVLARSLAVHFLSYSVYSFLHLYIRTGILAGTFLRPYSFLSVIGTADSRIWGSCCKTRNENKTEEILLPQAFDLCLENSNGVEGERGLSSICNGVATDTRLQAHTVYLIYNSLTTWRSFASKTI